MPDFGERVVKFENARCVRQNAAGTAIMVQLEDRDDDVWFPQVCIDDASEVWEHGQEGALVVSEKIATEKGLV